MARRERFGWPQELVERIQLVLQVTQIMDGQPGVHLSQSRVELLLDLTTRIGAMLRGTFSRIAANRSNETR